MNYLDILVRASIDVTAATENIKLPNAGTQVRRSPVFIRSKSPSPLPRANGPRTCCFGGHFTALLPRLGKENSDDVLRGCSPTQYFWGHLIVLCTWQVQGMLARQRKRCTSQLGRNPCLRLSLML